MRLICPNCDAQYEVDDGAVPPGGRDVQCSNCGHAWFQMHADFPEDVDAAGDLATVAVPPGPTPAVVESAPSAPVDSAAVPATAVADPVAADPPATPPPDGPIRRTLDDNLLAVLREEAAREAAERRSEAGRSIETQGDLGALDGGGRAAVVPPATAMTADAPDHPVTQRTNPRRDLLPDIEEINSTLRPGAEARDDSAAAFAAPVPKRAAFRTGFFSVLLVALVLVILYAMAPQLAARFPQAEPTLTAYITTVDTLRLWLDGLMQSAAGGLRNLTGEG